MEERPVIIPNSRRVDFTSKVNAHRYSISIGLPLDPPPENGYRVLYVFDGYAYFGSATEAVRVNGNAPGTVVVGLGYPDDGEFIQSTLARHGPLSPYFAQLPPIWAAIVFGRFYDLSLPASMDSFAELGLTEKNTGGLDDYLQTIELDVKPRVAAVAPIDASNQAIFGHSLGGLAVLHALFTMPNAFRTFVPASPSISWGDGVVLNAEKKFAAAVESGSARPRVLVTMGADEDIVPKHVLEREAKEGKTQAKRGNMVGDARELVARLQALRGTSPYEVEDYAIFPKQGHGISPWPALGRAISFAFPLPA